MTPLYQWANITAHSHPVQKQCRMRLKTGLPELKPMHHAATCVPDCLLLAYPSFAIGLFPVSSIVEIKLKLNNYANKFLFYWFSFRKPSLTPDPFSMLMAHIFLTPMVAHITLLVIIYSYWPFLQHCELLCGKQYVSGGQLCIYSQHNVWFIIDICWVSDLKHFINKIDNKITMEWLHAMESALHVESEILPSTLAALLIICVLWNKSLRLSGFPLPCLQSRQLDLSSSRSYPMLAFYESRLSQNPCNSFLKPPASRYSAPCSAVMALHRPKV